MPTLLNRLRRATSNENFRGHAFGAIVVAYLRGHITQNKAYTSLGIAGTGANRVAQQTDFERFKTQYDSYPATTQGNIDREMWLNDVIAYDQLLVDGHQTKAQFNTALGDLGFDLT